MDDRYHARCRRYGVDGLFRQQIARAHLKTLFASETAARLHVEYMQGMV